MRKIIFALMLLMSVSIFSQPIFYTATGSFETSNTSAALIFDIWLNGTYTNPVLGLMVANADKIDSVKIFGTFGRYDEIFHGGDSTNYEDMNIELCYQISLKDWKDSVISYVSGADLAYKQFAYFRLNESCPMRLICFGWFNDSDVAVSWGFKARR